MKYPLLILFFIYLLPYLGALLEYYSKIKIKTPILMLALCISFSWLWGIEIENKNVEFIGLYTSFILLTIFLFQYLKKSIVLCVCVVAIHTFFSFFTFLFEQRVTNYFEEKFILAENENYFVSFEQEVGFSMDMDEYFVLYQKLRGKSIYKKVERKFVEISSIEIEMEEKGDKVIVTTGKNQKLEYAL